MKKTGIFLVGLFLLSGCGEKIESKWTKQALVVDGKAEDEEFPYEYWFKDERVALSVMNDGDYIYFLVSAGSRALARMLSDQGVVLWFDPAGEENKARPETGRGQGHHHGDAGRGKNQGSRQKRTGSRLRGA